MKILYLAPAMADYQSDALFHGLRCLPEVAVVDVPKQEHMVMGGVVPPYGRGFTLFNLLPDIDVDRDGIPERIAAGEFDLVIIAGDYVYRDDPYPFEAVIRRWIPPGHVFIVDGGDSQAVVPAERRAWGTYFKRENAGSGRPISFAIPEEKLQCGIWPRPRLVAEYEPGMPYRYDAEQDYYEGYRTASFAKTSKKAGWDCLRHYEIMAAGCIPLFEGIEDLPADSCLTLPKRALERAQHEWESMDEATIAAVGQQIFNWCRTYCTTRVLAERVLAYIPRPQVVCA